MEQNSFYATGKRKTSMARTWIRPGSGKIMVNGMDVENYFKIDTHRLVLGQPLSLTERADRYDVTVTVKGGGISGQAGAVRHGITKALMEAEPELRAVLKKAGFITRDARAKERKKYGQRAARARFQFSKR
ncbi:30S ribosomal protein S9 [Desulfobotulus sp.]|jgi:small subunit ribosomal protein S9|uniref:30S ribosomal protein S9 n=1 Tax=Desulfobotulus sp. TaxID=1940337 RepID=UPI002A367EB0|nr:30S ribosomal protein S9 [Desulfobotulus sp.]MDY0163735.1 30S ribosomal protein S9 [Desulfobotulus sp.]